MTYTLRTILCIYACRRFYPC